MAFTFTFYFMVVAVSLTQAGPAVPRKRTISGPEVSQTQLYLQENFLKTQTQVLETSIQISKIVQMITKEAFRTSDEAKLALGLTTGMVLKAAEAIQNTKDLNIQQCTEKLGIRDALTSLKITMQLQIFGCTHTLSEKAMNIEKRMTSLINSVRAHIIQAMDSMWLCEPEEAKVGNVWTRVIDEACLTALKEEGEEIINYIPDKARDLLLRAQALESESKAVLEDCVAKTTSVMSTKATSFLEEIRNCSLPPFAMDFDSSLNMAKYIEV